MGLVWRVCVCVLPAGHSRCVDALITWGADVDQELPASGTPLYTSCRTAHSVCARKLLDAGVAQISRGLLQQLVLQRKFTNVKKTYLFTSSVNRNNVGTNNPELRTNLDKNRY